MYGRQVTFCRSRIGGRRGQRQGVGALPPFALFRAARGAFTPLLPSILLNFCCKNAPIQVCFKMLRLHAFFDERGA